jgi:transcriptional regulator with XRE-family HTH domain
MTEPVKNLISQIITLARRRGLTQAELAARAGLTAVGLSKAKQRGDIRASTLAALAAQLDLQLALVPKHTREQATEAIRSGTFFRVSAPPAVGED